MTHEPGGGTDFASRTIAQGLTASLGRQVIVDNRTGAFTAGAIVAKAPPDGHTVLVSTASLVISPFMYKVPFDPQQDFAPVTLAARSPNVLVAHPSLPAKSVRDLIGLARARPGELNYASASAGSAVHLAAELFNRMAGVSIVRVPYKGSGQAITGLIGGETQISFGTAASVAPHVKSGKLRALAVTSAQPTTLFPDLPTVASSGLPGYEAVSIWGMFVPARVPAAVVGRLNAETVRVLHASLVREKFFSIGVEAVGSSPEQFAATIKKEVEVWGKLIRDAGIRAD